MLEHLSGFTKKVADLQDKPNASMSATELKAWFDAQPEELRVFLNEKLTQIDTDFALKSELTATTLGQILDGSLTDVKLSDDPTQIKKRVSDFIALKGVANGLATLDSGGDIPVSQLGNVVVPSSETYFVAGTYTGDETVSKAIYLGFRPKAVIVVSKQGFMGEGAHSYGGFALDGYPALTPAGTNSIVITNNGFNVYYDYANKAFTNESDPPCNPFRYIAFK